VSSKLTKCVTHFWHLPLSKIDFSRPINRCSEGRQCFAVCWPPRDGFTGLAVFSYTYRLPHALRRFGCSWYINCVTHHFNNVCRRQMLRLLLVISILGGRLRSFCACTMPPASGKGVIYRRSLRLSEEMLTGHTKVSSFLFYGLLVGGGCGSVLKWVPGKFCHERLSGVSITAATARKT
jgi:hypothetical protein